VTSAETAPRATTLPVEIERLIAEGETTWRPGDRENVLNYYLRVAPELEEARREIEKREARLPSFPTTLVMQERPADHPRKTHRHHRGEYLSPKEEVEPGVPSLYEPLPEDEPANRLTFARWLVSERNPMAGRLVVNRAWRAFFGHGLVRTNGDYGTQANRPTHPKLLDWLSCKFVENGWSVKNLHRQIVLSATYRQAAAVSETRRERAPENRWLSRFPRVMVDAEVVRDIMLKSSGLLSDKIGGPSVFPPQPASVTELAYGNFAWKTSQGEDRFRRSLYTFSKRTAPFAAYAAYNAPTGENCITRRDRSSTPLQALTLLNDAMFLEMARALAKEAAELESPRKIAEEIFRRLLTRPPSENELDAVLSYYRQQKARLEAGELDAAKITGGGDTDLQLAAWVMVARAVMNLEETITKQ